MKKFRVLALILALVLCMSALTACGKGKSTGTVTEDGVSIFKIGGIGPLTGGAAVYGEAVRVGAQIAVDEINAAGGNIQFEYKFEDDESDTEKSVNAYNALKDWGMQIVLGSVTTNPCVATAAESFEDRIFQITPSASSTKVTEGHDNVFQVCFADPNNGIAAANYIVDNALGEKVAVIYRNDDDYSTGIYNTFKAEAEAIGLEIVSVTTFTNETANDFSVQLNEAKNAGADFIFIPIYAEPASLILAQADEMGYDVTFMGTDGMDGILSLEGFDPALAEGLIMITPFAADAQDDATQSFVAEFEARTGIVPNQFAADAYDAVYIIYAAIEAAGVTADMTTEEICDALIEVMPTLTYDGLTGEGMTWSAEGAVTKPSTAIVIKNGAYVGL